MLRTVSPTVTAVSSGVEDNEYLKITLKHPCDFCNVGGNNCSRVCSEALKYEQQSQREQII